MKTPTPRTDAAERKAHGIPDGFELLPNLYVSGDFARQLERELATMTALADRLAESLEASDECLALIEDVGHGAHMNNVSVARGSVQEALTAYENHKKPEQQIKKPCDCIEKCGKYWIQRCDCQNDTSLAEAQSWCDYENHKKGNTP